VFSIVYAGQDNGPIWFLVSFSVLAVLISSGAAIRLWTRRTELV